MSFKSFIVLVPGVMFKNAMFLWLLMFSVWCETFLKNSTFECWLAKTLRWAKKCFEERIKVGAKPFQQRNILPTTVLSNKMLLARFVNLTYKSENVMISKNLLWVQCVTTQCSLDLIHTYKIAIHYHSCLYLMRMNEIYRSLPFTTYPFQ